MRRYFVFLLLFFIPARSFAELQGKARLDSLIAALPNITNDTLKCRVLYSIAYKCKTTDPNMGIRYANLSLELASTLDDKNNIRRAYIALGLNHQYKSDYELALIYYNKGILLCSESDTTGDYSSIISHLAVLYQDMGNHDKALEYNLKCLKLDEHAKDSLAIADDLGNIGIVYLQKKDYEKALEYDFRSLELFRSKGHRDGVAHNYGNIGNVYNEYGNYVLALEYDTKALELFRDLGDDGGIAINLGNIGVVYGNVVATMDTGGQASKVLPKGTRQQFLDKAIANLEECIAISRKIEQLDNLVEYSKALSEVYGLKGDHRKALEHYKTYVLFKDSIYSDQNKLRLANLNTDREATLKEKQIQINELQNANKRKERIIYIVSLCMLGIVVGVIARKFVKQKQRNKLLALERKRNLERIEQQKEVMGDIAYTQAHDVSGEVSTILGLVDVFNTEDHADPDNKVVIDGIGETARKLDAIVKEMIIKENVVNKGRKT